MTAVTLTAGSFGSYRGYAKSGSPTGLGPIGSISGQPLSGFILDSLTTGPSNELWFEGNTTGVAFVLTVDGVAWPKSAGSFGGGYTSYSVTPPAGFTGGSTYTIDCKGYEGPAWVNATSGAGSTAATSIDFSSSGRAAGDELFIAVATANQAIATPTGFTEVTDNSASPQSRGTAAAAGGLRGAVFRKTSDGTETTVTIADSGDHQYAVGAVFRPASGQAIAIEAAAGRNAAAATSQTGNSLTTGVDECLNVDFWFTDRDNAGPTYSAQANASLTNVTKRFDAGTTQGQGSGIMIVTGEKATAGSVSATTATSAASAAYCVITLALKNTTGGGGTTLTPNNAAHTHTATQPALAAKSSVTPNSSTHASSSTSPGLVAYAPSVAITVGNASHAQAATSPSITAKSSVSPSDAVHGHTSTSPTLSAKSTVSPDNSVHAHASTQPTIATKSSVSLANALHSHEATSPALTLGTIGIAPVSSVHGHTATQPVLAFAATIVPAGSVHGHTATSPVIAVSGSITVNAATHAQSATSPPLAAKASVMVNGAVHGHAASEPTIGAHFSVAVNDNTLGHQATSPGLAFSFQVAPDSAWHAHIASCPALQFHRGDIRVPTASRPTFAGTTRPATPITLRPVQIGVPRPAQSISRRPRQISTGRR
ncbi:hypothetical protein [Novosphingobium sp. JCM 18896]|uniref:hypothetical protein n=1 Tax=Novosphingobium sp. JCM 18896 TaxID=2989731 RepID=UPI002223844C|nr:hypothetical protein [Novosphingobium sp. JCM 18896]MCW1431397.1 hypothetical protein [Novosphingobium sp. JCM 18896]